MSDASIVVWGEVLWDHYVDKHVAELGGAPANVAWHLGMAGARARLVSRVGDDDAGRRAVERLDTFVDTTLIQTDPERATGEVTIALAGAEPRYHLIADRAWERIACTELAIDALSDATALIYGTLAQRTPAGLAGWRAAHAATPTSCMRVCDLNLRRGDGPGAAVDDALAAADLIKINDRELAALREWFGWADPVAELRRTRPRVVAVTHGDAGSTLHGLDRTIEIAATPAAPGAERDNVGCGDAYLAILIFGMASGWELATCGAAASRWAAAVAAVRGATPTFSDEHIAELLEAA